MFLKKILFGYLSLSDAFLKDYSHRKLYLYTKETIEFGSIKNPPELVNIELFKKNSMLLIACDSDDFKGKIIIKAHSIFDQKKIMNLELPLFIKYKAFNDYISFIKNDKTDFKYFLNGWLSDKVYNNKIDIKHI